MFKSGVTIQFVPRNVVLHGADQSGSLVHMWMACGSIGSGVITTTHVACCAGGFVIHASGGQAVRLPEAEGCAEDRRVPCSGKRRAANACI